MIDLRSPANRLLKELGVAVPQDIDVEAIAYHCKCKVKYRHLDGCAARLVGTAARAIISVDVRSRLERRRFSIGHELGHWISDRGKAAFHCGADDLRRPWNKALHPEARANGFAADLLMPDYLFQPMARRREITFTTADDLANVFSVGRIAAAMRLIEHGAYDAMLVCFGVEGRRWFQGSRRIGGNLWPVSELNPNTDAYDILHGAAGSGRSLTVDADDWIKHPRAKDYSLREHSVKAGDAVLSLLWWQDPSMVEDLVP